MSQRTKVRRHGVHVIVYELRNFISVDDCFARTKLTSVAANKSTVHRTESDVHDS